MNRIIAFAAAVFMGTLAWLQLSNPAGGSGQGVFSTNDRLSGGNEQAQLEQVRLEQARREASEGSRSSSASSAHASGNAVTIQRGADSHFRTMVTINGRDIEMMVDSGATSVALSRRDAERVGIFVGGYNDFNETAQTAGGEIRIKPVKLNRVAVGKLERRNIDAAIIDEDIGMSLLGQSYLSQISNVTIKGDVMTLE